MSEGGESDRALVQGSRAVGANVRQSRVFSIF
jgi:hypothetical protein